MSHPLRRVLIFLAAGALTMLAPVAEAGRQRAAAPGKAATAPAEPRFRTTQVEFYLTEDSIAYVRPGLNVKVESITIPEDRRPVVEVTFTDDMNQPLDRLGQVTPGAISASFILAVYDPATRLYTPYTTRVQNAAPSAPNAPASDVQASADSGGTWTDLATGRARYRFRTALPEGYDPSSRAWADAGTAIGPTSDPTPDVAMVAATPAARTTEASRERARVVGRDWPCVRVMSSPPTGTSSLPRSR